MKEKVIFNDAQHEVLLDYMMKTGLIVVFFIAAIFFLWALFYEQTEVGGQKIATECDIKCIESDLIATERKIKRESYVKLTALYDHFNLEYVEGVVVYREPTVRRKK